jgi:hypothetical protein
MTYPQATIPTSSTNVSALTVTKPVTKAKSTTTERKIGKITYLVVASHSAAATETAKQKIEKLIQRECDRLEK